MKISLFAAWFLPLLWGSQALDEGHGLSRGLYGFTTPVENEDYCCREFPTRRLVEGAPRKLLEPDHCDNAGPCDLDCYQCTSYTEYCSDAKGVCTKDEFKAWCTPPVGPPPTPCVFPECPPGTVFSRTGPDCDDFTCDEGPTRKLESSPSNEPEASEPKDRKLDSRNLVGPAGEYCPACVFDFSCGGDTYCCREVVYRPTRRLQEDQRRLDCTAQGDCDMECLHCDTLEEYCTTYFDGNPTGCTLDDFKNWCGALIYGGPRARKLEEEQKISKDQDHRALDGILNPGNICPPCKETGTCGGDPHFQAWSGEYFDYHAACDLVFLHAPKFGKGLGLAIHIRTTARYEYSFIESAALRIGDDILEVSSFGEYSLNGVTTAELPAKMADLYEITYIHKQKKKHIFNVHLGGNENIVVTAFKDLVGVKMGNATMDSFGESQGLMGDYTSGELVARDGKTVLKDPNEFGQEWQVLESEAKLFQTVRAPQHPQVCTPPGLSKMGRRLGEGISKDAAQEACSHWGEENKHLCVYDVLAMQDLEVAHQVGAY